MEKWSGASSLKFFMFWFGVFLLLASPALFLKSSPQTQKLSLQYPKQQRGLASKVQSAALGVAERRCELAERWRFRCDENQKNCVKDRRETYRKCHSL